MISTLFFALLTTLGFGILFHVPRRYIIIAAVTGAFGWFAFEALVAYGSGKIFSCFLSACLVGLLGEIFSRILKEAATLFVIPGILLLVPGSGMYYTMLALVGGNLQEAARIGIETVMMAGSIAVGLLVVGSVIKVIVSIKQKFRPLD